jgi:hypothetical protein
MILQTGRRFGFINDCVLHDDECLGYLLTGLVRDSDHSRGLDIRMGHQGVFDFIRTDSIAGTDDHLVLAADEPEIAVRITRCQILREEPGSRLFRGSFLLPTQIFDETRWIIPSNGQLADLPRSDGRGPTGLEDLDRVLITHYDLDHVGGLRRLGADIDCPVYVGRDDLRLVRGDDDPSLPSAAERARVRASVEATREEAGEKLSQAVAALETIRLGLLHLHAGSGTLEHVTTELEAARDLSDDMEHLLAGHREVERILRERRQTGAFKLVDPSPTGPPS